MAAEQAPGSLRVAAARTFRLAPDGVWAAAWKAALTLGVLGALGSVAGFVLDAERFAFAYLFAFATVLTLGLGALFFTILQHLTVAGWSVSVRRLAENLLLGWPVLLLAFVPLLFMLPTLYEWTHSGHGADASHASAASHDAHVADAAHKAPAVVHGADAAHAADSESGYAGGHTDQESALHHHLVDHKRPYLNLPFFGVRAVLYFIIWLVLAFFYRRNSLRQDADGDPAHTVRSQRWAPLAMALFGLSLTFAGFDWLMSLEPAWYSTIYGVYIFAGSAMAVHALLIVLGAAFGAAQGLGRAVNTEHFHDLGKLMFGFMCFWAYIGVSQFLLIWYAGIPEEATFYHRRWDGAGWTDVSLTLVVGHFAAPFLLIMSRVAKRKLSAIVVAACWLLAMHVLDVYWLVLPYAGDGHFQPQWFDIAALLAVAGLFFTPVLRGMHAHPLLPAGDPRLSRALNFVNA
ncbi:MAG: hypothetical protein ACPGUV_03485 [Polyangiales bacterium]